VVRVLAVVVLALSVGGSAFAQSDSASTTAPVGAMFNVAGTVLSGFQVVGDVGYVYKDGFSLTTYTGGVRYLISVDPTGRVTPFVEALAGGGRIGMGDVGSATGVTFGAGAGVDVKALSAAGLRLQVNYFHTQKYGVAIHEVRFGVGVSFGNKLVKVAGGWAPSWLKATGNQEE
jgi:hypothetical protein